MAALREHAYLVAVGELRQADGAVLRELLLDGAVVGELGEGSDDLLLQALVLRGLTTGEAAGGSKKGAAKPGAASDKGEFDYADEGAEEGGEYDNDG
ncbi:hypothetical protein AAC387_Pa02g3444 [Persea americana]